MAEAFPLHLDPSKDFRDPLSGGLLDSVTVHLHYQIERLDDLHGVTPVIHKVDALGIWCSDGDYVPGSTKGAKEPDLVYRLVLIPWSSVRDVRFFLAT